jgi:aminoglycoside phosphotransferase (APT) family kinase protein
VVAPRPVYLDQAGDIFSTPAVVIEYVEGTTEFAPADLPEFILQCAGQLSRIHALDGSNPDVSFLPKQEALVAEKLRERPATLDESLDEGRIRHALESVWPLPPRNGPALLHGDFWPGNLLWRDDRLVAVIDWEDAAVGDPLADVANSRLEILWAFGMEAMRLFTQRYQALTAVDFTDLPYWDLWAALRPAGRLSEWAVGEATERAMRVGHRAFVAQAFETLSARRTN